jgi:hypothetical protein
MVPVQKIFSLSAVFVLLKLMEAVFVHAGRSVRFIVALFSVGQFVCQSIDLYTYVQYQVSDTIS